MTSPCLFCGTVTEPSRWPRKLIARYRCPHCRLRWLVCWDTASLEDAA